MSEFIDFKAEVDNDVSNNESVISNTDCEIIDDSETGNDLSFYRLLNQLENVGNVDEILQEELEAEYNKVQNLELHNLCEPDEYLGSVVELKDTKKQLEVFENTFFRKVNN